MILVDSHCHLNLLDLSHHEGHLSAVIKNAHDHFVNYFLSVSVTLQDVPTLLDIAALYPSVSCSVGLHPNEPVEDEPSADDLIRLSQAQAVVAIGETGLDYYRTDEKMEWQHQRFREHIRAAIALRLPLIIHTRKARADTLQIMREEHADQVGGVMHCFTEDWATAKAALDMGFYISFSGIITFRNAKEIQAVAKEVPLDRLLIETDCPYLTPEPFRGKPNEPAYVRYVAESIASLRGLDVHAVADQTTKNFFNLFKKAER